MISHHHKCVFVHIPKCAGQSIESIFLGLLGLTWETRAPLLLRPNDRPELGPPKLAHLKWDEYVSCNYLTQEQFDSYFKFSFVRDPWSRVVSMYKYLGAQGYHKNYDFKNFLKKEFRNEIWNDMYWFVGPQYEFFCDAEDRRRVDFVGRVETLQADFNQICEKIGLAPIDVPHSNVSQKKAPENPKHRPAPLPRWLRKKQFPRFAKFQDYYDDESRDLVAELYRKDIELLGFEWQAG